LLNISIYEGSIESFKILLKNKELNIKKINLERIIKYNDYNFLEILLKRKDLILTKEHLNIAHGDCLIILKKHIRKNKIKNLL
jgi:hypothetical protein